MNKRSDDDLDFKKNLADAISVLKSRPGWQAAESVCKVNLQLGEAVEALVPRTMEQKVLADLDTKAESFLPLVEDLDTRDAYGWLLGHFQRSALPHVIGTQLEQKVEERVQHWWEQAWRLGYQKDGSLSLREQGIGSSVIRFDRWLQRLIGETGPSRGRAPDEPEPQRPSSSHSGSDAARRKKRGRPQTIPSEKKAAAAELKASGGTNKQVAALLYSTKHPTVQQTKNVPSILKHYRQKSAPPGSPVNTRKASPKPRKIRG